MTDAVEVIGGQLDADDPRRRPRSPGSSLAPTHPLGFATRIGEGLRLLLSIVAVA